eukprot:scaffold3086_cov139-Skeletonema_menzelii.AAC.2
MVVEVRMDRTNSIPWDEDMPALVDHGDNSIESSSSKESELLPQKLQFNNSGDSTDVSTNPSVATADNGNPVKQDTVGKQEKNAKKSMLSRMKTPFRGSKAKSIVTSNKAPHTLHSADDWGNVECYVLDAHAVRVEEREKTKSLRPVGLVSDDCGNVECCALEKGAVYTEQMKPPVEKLVKKSSVEEQQEQQQCSIAQFRKQICMQPSSDTTMMADCQKGVVDCSFYDQVYAQLMGSPSDLNEPLSCKENLNLPGSKDVVDGSKKVVEGGMKLFDNTVDFVVGGLFPMRENFTTIQGLAIVHSESEVEMEHSDTQAEI